MSKCPRCGEALATHYNDTETFKRCIHCGYKTHSAEEEFLYEVKHLYGKLSYEKHDWHSFYTGALEIDTKREIEITMLRKKLDIAVEALEKLSRRSSNRLTQDIAIKALVKIKGM